MTRSNVGAKVPSHGNETILLTEDEPAVRALARHALQMHGYSVLEASQSDEALRAAGDYKGTIHLLVTDVVMPGMSGRQLAEHLALIRPGLKVLYLSGYTDDAVIRHGVLRAEAAFLQKPFAPSALAAKVREVLDQ
jgi:DNA-binding response OmpR family regulator